MTGFQQVYRARGKAKEASAGWVGTGIGLTLCHGGGFGHCGREPQKLRLRLLRHDDPTGEPTATAFDEEGRLLTPQHLPPRIRSIGR